jgi:histone deacetylase 1/2
LDVKASNMENANSRDYLEKIKTQVINNLRKTGPPSVQMTDVPRTTITGGTEEDEDIADDMDEDDNKDARSTKRRWDQRITRDDELEESDDEEQDHANGVRQQNGAAKRRNIMDYQNPNPVASDVEMSSGIPTPALAEADDPVTAMATEVNAEVNAEIMEQKTLDATVEPGEQGPSNAPSRAHSLKPTIDTEGDVDMTGADSLPEVKAPSPVSNPASSPKPVEAAAPPAAPVEPVSEATDTAVVKEEGVAEKTDAAVTAEASTEIAGQSQP